jgi:hypothetical protein
MYEFDDFAKLIDDYAIASKNYGNRAILGP